MWGSRAQVHAVPERFTTGLTLPIAEVDVLLPERTFWEKATLVHVECNRRSLASTSARGRVVGIEVKASSTVTAADLAGLRALAETSARAAPAEAATALAALFEGMARMFSGPSTRT